jgi:hypothetical protein
MLPLSWLLLVAPLPAADTLRIEVGSPLVDGRIYAPHAARVLVRIGGPDAPVSAEWTNELTLGDSAGQRVMRWVTRGTRTPPGGGAPVRWELFQTYDARTMAPYGYHMRSSAGAYSRLSFEGRRVKGVRRMPGDTATREVNLELDRPGFIASASDLVPLAVGLKEGTVMVAPVWGPTLPDAELRIFSVLGKVSMNVEGKPTPCWKVEERRYSDRTLVANWYLVEDSPYMVYGEVPLPDGRVQHMSEVAIPQR